MKIKKGRKHVAVQSHGLSGVVYTTASNACSSPVVLSHPVTEAAKQILLSHQQRVTFSKIRKPVLHHTATKAIVLEKKGVVLKNCN